MNGGMMNGGMKDAKMGCSCGKSSCMSCGKGGMGCCKCPHHKVPVLMVLLIGVAFLGQAMGWWAASSVDVAWPVFVIIGALTKLTGSKCKCC